MMKNNKLFKTVMLSPVILYSILLIALPILYIFIISFFKSDSYGGMIHTFTLTNYLELFNISYIKIFFQSILIAIITTIICILISYPFVLAISHKSKKTQQSKAWYAYHPKRNKVDVIVVGLQIIEFFVAHHIDDIANHDRRNQSRKDSVKG